MFRILVVEDDTNTRRLMQAVLQANGYQPLLAGDGMEALAMMEKNQVDAIILDVMMPRMDGYALAADLRAGGSDIPILMVTAKEALADKKRGLRIGVDDYMVKPADEEEMLLRLAALLRRARIASEHKLRIGAVTLDYDALTVSRGAIAVTLPKKEFLLLFHLLSYPNKIFTRRQLMDAVWDMDSDTDERTVDVHINRLRERFRNYAEFEIVTVRGLGYKAVKKE